MIAESRAYNMDCIEAMKQMPDKCFDLAVVDPPYGGGCSQNVHVEREAGSGLQGGATDFHGRFGSRFGGLFDRYHIGDWDVAPPPEYFQQLARVSKGQIIWGGNYFDLPPTRCFLVWRKTNIPLEGFSMAPVEYAWTSFNGNAGMFECFSSGGSGREARFHPTQKPVELYTWIFSHYAKAGDKILDTHLGSGSSRIAAYDLGLDFTGYEIDQTYLRLEEERFAAHAAQLSLFG